MLSTLKNILLVLQGIPPLLRLIGNPDRTEDAFRLTSLAFTPSVLNTLKIQVSKTKEGQKALQEKFRVQVDMNFLSQCPPHSLGHAFYQFITRNNLNPNLFPKIKVKNDNDYLFIHFYETHDLWHVITGFNTTVEDELALQAFYSAQTPSPLALLLIGAGFFRTLLFNFQKRDELFKAIILGYSLGKKAKPLFGFPWHQHWHTPLIKIRNRLSIAS